MRCFYDDRSVLPISFLVVAFFFFLSITPVVRTGSPLQESSLYNETVLTNDISRVSLRKLVSGYLANMTSFIAAFNSAKMMRDESVRDDDGMNGIMGAISSGASSVLSSLSPDFTCKKTEKQLVTVSRDKAKVCCNSVLDITRTCATHRCAALTAGASCCLSQKTNRHLCRGINLGVAISSIMGAIGKGVAGAMGSTTQQGVETVGQPTVCRSGAADVRIDLKTSQARTCCLSTSPCGGLFPCNTIIKRTYKSTNRVEYCCQAMVGSQVFCTGNPKGGVAPPPRPAPPQVVYPPQPVYPPPQPVNPQPVYPQPPVQPVYPPPGPVYPLPEQIIPINPDPVIPSPRPCLYTREATSGKIELLNAKLQAAAILLRERLTDQSLVARLNDIVLSIGNRLASGIVSRSDGPFKHYLDPR